MKRERCLRSTRATGTRRRLPERQQGSRKPLFSAGFRPAYSQIYLPYGPRREVRFKPGAGRPPLIAKLAGEYFSAKRVLKKAGGEGLADFLHEQEVS
jgi:hypothetical protein